MTSPRFEPSISLGNLLTALLLLATLVGGWVSMDSRVSKVEAQVVSMASTEANMLIGIRRIDDKVTAILLQGYPRASTRHNTEDNP